MKQVFILTAIIGLAVSARLDQLYLPANQRSFSSGAYGGFNAQTYSSSGLSQVPILKFAADNNEDGSYRYNYETGNGIAAEEQGEARGAGTKAQGSFSYTSPEGQHVSVSYVANENGFLPQGSHIPIPPPIPEDILRSLQENAAAEARGIFNEGSYRGEGENEGQYKGEGAYSGSNGAYRY